MNEPRIVADGAQRNRADHEIEIRARVEAEYEAALAAAKPLRRFLLRARMEREIRRAVRDAAPPEALYLQA